MSDLKNIKNKFLIKLNTELSLEEINQIKTELFGKSGLIHLNLKILDLYLRQREKNLLLILTKLKMSFKI